MAKSVKLADIAAKLDISTVTVSKALSDKKGVSEKLRDEVKKLADEMGYKQPSAIRKEKKVQSNKSYNIGVLISDDYLDKYDTFYWQMYQMVTTSAVSLGCFTIFEVISEDDEKIDKIPKIIQEQKIEGIIVIGRTKKHYLEMLERTLLPLIYLDFCTEKVNCDAVISDSYYGAYMMTNYLFDIGHKEIAYVGTLMATGSITDRYFGYCKSLMEHGVDIRKDWIISDRNMDNGQIDAINLLQLPKEMPTAFVCNCDLTASVLIKKLEKNGFHVPADISVVGYDNYLFPGLSDVAITTYEVDMKDMACKAVDLLLKKISGEEYRKGLTIVEGNIVYKDSVRSIERNN